jgi:hypothetical protein
MNDIRINPVVLLAVLAAAIVAGVALQMPEIRRYLKVRSM